MIDAASGKPLTVEFLVSSSAQERVVLLFGKSLRRLGIRVSVRKVEASQYQARIGRFDFDMIQWRYSASLSPGNEQFNRWSTKAADTPFSLNFAGVKNPAVDAMIQALLQATDRAPFESAVRAFDRALLSGSYLIPLFHVPAEWYAVWSELRFPPEPPLRGTSYSYWWHARAGNQRDARSR